MTRVFLVLRRPEQLPVMYEQGEWGFVNTRSEVPQGPSKGASAKEALSWSSRAVIRPHILAAHVGPSWLICQANPGDPRVCIELVYDHWI
jgi:hypothetical protein